MRAALCYLGAGFLAGAILLANRGLALGVAFWILPRFRSGPERRREVWKSWLP